MRPDQLKQLLRYIAGLFQSTTVDQKAFLERELLPLDYLTAKRAVDEHRRANQAIDFPELVEACKGTQAPARRPVKTDQDVEGSWFDVMRRLDPQLADVQCDREVALRVYRKRWTAARGQESARGSIDRECRQKLEATGMTPEEAADWSSAVFREPDYFKLCLDTLRGAAPLPFMPDNIPAARVAS